MKRFLDDPNHIRLRTAVREGLWSHYLPSGLMSPRDNPMIGKSDDMPFQFQLLTHRQRGCHRVAVFRKEREWMYLVRDEKGDLLHPMTGMPFEPEESWRPAGTVKLGSIEKHVKSFWGFRDLGKGLRSGRARYTLRVDGLCLCEDGKLDKEALGVAGKRWPGWALGRGRDSVRDGFRDLRLVDLSAGETASLEGDVALCPIDGPVPFVVGEYSSPRSDWKNLCGREFEYALCPRCLGAFEVKLTFMN
jgi:hypothetical protein